MATDEQTMAWMMDTYSMQVGYAVPGDRHRQADLDRRLGVPARGHGRRGVMVIERACERWAGSSPSQRCVVQGFGKVGGDRRARAGRRGAIVIGVSDVSGGLYDSAGSTSRRLLARTRASTAR